MADRVNYMQRPGAPVQSPIATKDGFAHADWAMFHATSGDVSAFGPTICDTAANRANGPSASPYYGPGRFLRYLYYETDTGLLFVSTIVAGVPTWRPVNGIQIVALLSQLPAGLTLEDGGLLVGELQYRHMYLWTGTVWTFAPGDSGAGYIVGAVSSPTGGVWAICNGSSVAVSLGNGTTGGIATPNLTGDTFLMGSAVASGVRPATVPTWQASQTDTDAGSGTVVQSGTGITVAAHPHQHTIANGNANLFPPDLVNGGLPQNLSLKWYMRQ